MMRSMFAGVSGLRSHQTMMDVVGHNIANVNTAGYKSSMVTFQEALTQTLRGASGSGTDRGGINPIQMGLGVRVAAVDGVFTQGATQVTGRSTDVAIQGDGFFMLEQNVERIYTRAGSFSFDEVGNLVAAGGMRVQGWTADPNGAIDHESPIGAITLPLAQVIDPKRTGEVHIGGNLSSGMAVGETHSTSIKVFDSLGAAHELWLQFEKTGPNAWSMAGTVDGNALTLAPATISFNSDGSLASAPVIAASGWTPPGADPLAFDLVLDGPSALVQFGGATSAEGLAQDGNAIGFLRNFAISENGLITGQFSNGETKVLAQIATATFNNPAGLQRVGSTHYVTSVNSGEPLVGEPGSGNRGLMTTGALEMSNVDLALEFTNLIIAQRGFQANSRIITASDELLADLVNLKR